MWAEQRQSNKGNWSSNEVVNSTTPHIEQLEFT